MFANQNFFSGLNQTKIGEAGYPKISAGFDGDVKVLKTLVKQTQSAGLAFIAELEVVTSNHPSHAVGTVISFFQSMVHQQVAFARIKEFLVSAWGINRADEAQMSQIEPHLETILNQAVSSPTQNQLTGRVLHARGETAVSQSSGRSFVKKIFTLATGKAGPLVEEATAAPQSQPVLPGPGSMPTMPAVTVAPGVSPGTPAPLPYPPTVLK